MTTEDDARREADRKETQARMDLESATFAAREAGLDAEDVLDTVTGASDEFDIEAAPPTKQTTKGATDAR